MFNPISRTTETRHKCKCRLDTSACNNKQNWIDDKCSCECKELIKVYVIKDLFGILIIVSVSVTNHVMMGEYLDYENCKCRKKLVEECTENIGKVKIAGMALFKHGNESLRSCTICVVLAVIAITITISIGAYFTNKYMNGNTENVSKYDYVYQATNY